MNRLRKAVRDYLTMRRGLGFKLVDRGRAAGVRRHSWRENAVLASPSIWHWSGQPGIPTTQPVSGRRGSASCAASPGTGVRRIPRPKFRHSVCCLIVPTRSTILLFRSGNPDTAESCQKPTFH